MNGGPTCINPKKDWSLIWVLVLYIQDDSWDYFPLVDRFNIRGREGKYRGKGVNYGLR